MFNIGHGFDLHRLEEGNGFMLGGVWIKHTQAVIAHSDGDLLIHALADALLGAAALGDIGQHFPDTDNKFYNMSGSDLLLQVLLKIHHKGFTFNNADVTLVIQQPKIAPYIQAIKDNLMQILGCDNDRINIKATTTENLGVIGRNEAISAYAVASLIKQL